MDRKPKPPAGAMSRTCAVCQKVFRPMTEAQWRVIQRIHNENSLRHQRAEQTKPRRNNSG